MAKRPIFIVGAGGFARELRWLIEELNRQRECYEFAGYLVPDPKKPGEHDDSRGPLLSYSEWMKSPLRGAAVALGMGDPAARLRCGEEISSTLGQEALPVLIHPGVVIDRDSCRLELGTIICAGCIVTVNVNIGRYARVDRGCNIGHEAEIGDAASINPTVTISGGVRVGKCAMIGTGAHILQYLAIGDKAVVGAGALVNRNVTPGATVVGVPARPITRK